MGARTAFKDEDICRLGVLRTLWRGKPFMDYLPPVSPVTLRWKNEAPSRERKETNRERKSETGRGSVQGREEKKGQGWREELSRERGCCPNAAHVLTLCSQHCTPDKLERVEKG